MENVTPQQPGTCVTMRHAHQSTYLLFEVAPQPR